MPAIFTSQTPLTFVDFDYEALFSDIGKRLGSLSFYSDWKNFWMDVFNKNDQKIHNFIKQNPGSNPIREVMKKHGVTQFNYEYFVYQLNTAGGPFYFHFDVEKMKVIQHKYQDKFNIPIENLSVTDIYIDPTTPLVNKSTDQRLPYLTNMYGSDKPFICVDGNKRIQFKIKNSNVQSIKAYVFNENHWRSMFFLDCDVDFMWFVRELQVLCDMLRDNYTEKQILEQTHMHMEKLNQ